MSNNSFVDQHAFDGMRKHLAQDFEQIIHLDCFPLSHLTDSALTQLRQHYSDESITKEQIFHYIYAILHHPVYRERYADNLKRELPRIPFAPDFKSFAKAGKELAHLHLNYESLEPWPLEHIEQKGVPYSEHVTKMKLSKDRTSHPGQRLAHNRRHPGRNIQLQTRIKVSH